MLPFGKQPNSTPYLSYIHCLKHTKMEYCNTLSPLIVSDPSLSFSLSACTVLYFIYLGIKYHEQQKMHSLSTFTINNYSIEFNRAFQYELFS